MHQLIHVLLVLVFLYAVHNVLNVYNYTITFVNTPNISIIFEPINIINDMNVNTVLDSIILIIIESIGIIICSFISNTNIIFETSKKLRKIITQREQIQLAMNENCHNSQNGYSHDNVNRTHYLDLINVITTGIEGYDVIGYDCLHLYVSISFVISVEYERYHYDTTYNSNTSEFVIIIGG